MYSAYKLNKQGDNIQPWCTPFPIWNPSVVPCPVLTVASWPADRFLRRQVRWSGIPISCRIFQSWLWSTQSRLWCSPWSRNRCFSGTLLLFRWQRILAIWFLAPLPFLKPAWTSGSSQLKSGLENFEHYFASVGDECNWVVAWTFFGIAFLWDWNENWPFPVLWPLLNFQQWLELLNWLEYWVKLFDSIIF